jgi:hypothetical protein
MIRNLTRTNELSNPHESWTFELTDTGETYYYMTRPSYDHLDLPDTFLTVFRGSEPNETETIWYLPEFLSLSGDAEKKILRVLLLGDHTIEWVIYPP